MSYLRVLVCVLAVTVLAGLGGRGRADPQRTTIKLGILHSLTGTMAISEAALKDAELLAIEEINKAGGVLGKQVEAVVEDPQSRFTDGFPEKARKLLLRDKVAAVFGCWVSVSRKNVLPVFEENHGLLFYPVAYEGNESSDNIVYTGMVPSQQVLPAVDWLMSTEGGAKKKFYLVGSDYIYPRTVNYLVAHHLKAKGLPPVAEKYTPLGHLDYAEVVQDIKRTSPDVILSTINGDSNVAFFKELAAQGITPAKVPVVSLSVDEADLRGLDDKALAPFVGHLAAAGYFQSVPTTANKLFVRRFRAKYGKDRVTTDAIEAAYAQVYLWKQAVEKARSTDVDKVRQALRGLELQAPEGKLKIDAKNQHAWRRLRIGRVNRDRQFDILFESPEWLRPEPYPALLKRPGR